MTPQQPLKLVCDLCFTNDTRLRKPGGQGRTHHNRLAWSFWKRTERGPQAVVKGGPGREAGDPHSREESENKVTS